MGFSSSEVVKQRFATPGQMGCRGDSRVRSGIKIYKLLKDRGFLNPWVLSVEPLIGSSSNLRL